MICVSEFISRRDITQLHLTVPTRVVHNGIDLTRFCPDPTPPSPNVIGYAGQLIHEKGVQTLIRAVGMIPGLRLRIAGQGVAEAELRALAEAVAPGRVDFLGQIDEVQNLFTQSTVVVIPSEWDEAFGFVAIEALACGTAVVVSDAGALPEVVGEAGLSFRRGDSDHLATVLRDLLGDQDRLARCRGLARIQAERFSLERMVDGYLELYDQLRSEVV